MGASEFNFAAERARQAAVFVRCLMVSSLALGQEGHVSCLLSGRVGFSPSVRRGMFIVRESGFLALRQEGNVSLECEMITINDSFGEERRIGKVNMALLAEGEQHRSP